MDSRSPRAYPAHVFWLGQIKMGDVITDDELALRYGLLNARKGPIPIEELRWRPAWNTVGIKVYDPIESLFSFLHIQTNMTRRNLH